MKKFLIRILFVVLLLFALIILPWWLYIIVGIFGIFLFANFYEFFIISILSDLLYGPTQAITVFSEKNILFAFILSIISIILIMFIEKFKKNLLFYNG